MINSTEDIKKFINDNSFRKIFLLCGKKSFVTSGAEIFFKGLLNNKEIKFIITDFENEIIVSYKGAIPNLFLEEKGVIAEGKLKDRKYFIAEKILAKHDENYMPPELQKALKKNVK